MNVHQVFNVPNSITLFRLLLIPCFFAGLYYEYIGYHWLDIPTRVALILILLSDMLDGYLARKLESVTELGRLLDPIADKLFVTTSFIALAAFQQTPVWLTIVVVSKDLFTLVGWCVIAILYNRFEVNPSALGKAATAFQFTTVFLVVVTPWLTLIIEFWQFATAALTILALIHYAYLAFAAERSQQTVEKE